jgi:hypothetical protein
MEVLVAIAVLGLLAGVVYATFEQVTVSVRRVEREGDLHHQVRVTMDKLTQALGSAYWRPDRANTVFVGEAGLLEIYPSDRLQFTTQASHPYRDAMRLDLSLLTLSLQPSPDPDEPRSVLLYEEEMNLYSLSSDTLAVYELGDNLVGLGFRYYNDGEWETGWDAALEQKLPPAVEVTMILLDENRREKGFTTVVTLPMATAVTSK